MLDACRVAGIPEPTIAESTGGFLITFRRSKGGDTSLGAPEVGTRPAPGRRKVAGAVTPPVTPPVTQPVTQPVLTLLALLHQQGELGAQGIREGLGLKDRTHAREAYVDPAIDAHLIEMTIPDKPTSSRQRYRLTDRGRAWLLSRLGRDLKGTATSGRVRPRYESRRRRKAGTELHGD